MATVPHLIVIAGPNGAGKSTAASHLLPEGMIFVNADEVAKRLPGYPSKSVDLQAGRLVLEQMDQLEERQADFAVETTLASRALANRIVRLRQSGYLFRLIFIWSPSADFSVQRVAARVRAGGHDIPEETIRRRYEAGIKNFFHLYRPLADTWEVHEGTRIAEFRIIAQGQTDRPIEVHDLELWNLVCQRGNDA